MRIVHLAAKNFRTLEDFSVDFSPTYCTISGKNNAGKSAIVKIIEYFFDEIGDGDYNPYRNKDISFQKDKTQWSNCENVEISVCVELDRNDDSEVFFVVERYSNKKFEESVIKVELLHTFASDGSTLSNCKVNGEDVSDRDAIEIVKKFRSASNLIVHNSVSPSRRFFYLEEGMTEVLEAHFSNEDRKKVADASNNLQMKIKQAARQHKEELGKLLGRLNERYQVELTTINGGHSSRFPLQIKLTDKSVEVPLKDWGAGTQNRTRILMSVLDVLRIRSSATESDRSTPVFIVEEPESFLHPSAQAEFGQVLSGLSNELGIQIIATTHSPYLLNQVDPTANILLDRKAYRGSLRETQLIATQGEDWMLPFSEKLGIIPSEFDSWRCVFNSQSSRAILVEGDIDKKYFEIIKSRYSKIYKIPSDVEIVPYGGKDALKNTALLQFMVRKFGRVFVTYDLDAQGEVKQYLERIGLVEAKDFCAIGVLGAGNDCIEGLLPPSVKQKVISTRFELVSALASQDSKARTHAKSALKTALLDEFQKTTLDDKELASFSKLFSTIGKAFT